jgi:hypothetical protein
MKKIILWMGILLFVASCSPQKKLTEKTTTPVVEIAKKDSVEYQLETFDQRFESWYTMQKNQAQYRSPSFYEYWNKRYVTEWNAKAADPINNPFFEPIEGYDYHTHYGFKLNHKLFYYFQYVEHVLKIPILSHGPHVILHWFIEMAKTPSPQTGLFSPVIRPKPEPGTFWSKKVGMPCLLSFCFRKTKKARKFLPRLSCDSSEARTRDPLLKRQMLYLLS